MSRIDTLREFLKDDPKDSFSRYALGMEYAKLERYADSIAEFRKVVENDPNYVATYYQLGKVHEQRAEFDEAREIYRRGADIARQAGDTHTQEELEAALEALNGAI
jgi:tetratricopeptide (TPR) repeat protein